MTSRSLLAWPSVAVLALALVACSPTVTPGPTPSDTLTTTPTPSETPSPEPTTVTQEITLPRDCTDIFTASFIAQMDAWAMPLNHEGITMFSTQLIQGQSALARVPVLACTWGAPSDVGIATSVAIVTEEQATTIINEAVTNGYECGPVSAVEVRCDIFESGESEFGDYIWGEEHVFRGNAWVSTSYLNFDIGNYTNDIVTALWW